MSTNKLKRAGAPAFLEQKPGLRLVKSLDERPRLKPEPKLKAILEDLNRRSRVPHESGPDGKDAA